MRNIVLARGAVAMIGFVAPLSSPARAEKIVIKHGDRGLHCGWRHHHGWELHHARKS